MSLFTSNYAFEKPERGSYVDTWDVPVNQNWDDIDLEIHNVQDDFDTHVADNVDPHGQILTQNTLVIAHNAPGTGNAIDITNTVGGLDIDGYNSNWWVDCFGNAMFESISTNGGLGVSFVIFTRVEMVGADGAGVDNRVFTLPTAYVVGQNTLSVYVNGLLTREGAGDDYIETDNSTVTFTYDLEDDDSVTFDIGKTIGQLNGFGAIYSVAAAPGQTVFDLPWTFIPGVNNVDVFVDGSLKLLTSDYIETDSDTITFTAPMAGGEVVVIRKVRDVLATTTHHYQHEAGQPDEIHLDNLGVAVNGEGIKLRSPSGSVYKLTVDDTGAVITTLIP